MSKGEKNHIDEWLQKEIRKGITIIDYVLQNGENKWKLYYTGHLHKDIKKYFKEFNTAIFNGKLSPFGQIEIKDLKKEKCIGQVITLEWRRKGTRMYKLEMLPAYPDKKDFLDTLVHEMVHLYQMQNLGDTGNHNELFWSFEPKVNYIGLRL